MFKYDGFYNKLFEDKEFVNILCSFHTSNWGLMDKEARFSVIKKFVDRYCFLLGIPSLKIKKYKNKKTSGFYSDNKLQVAVNEKSVENGNPYDVLDTLFHETRHNFQIRAISKNLSSIECASEEKIKEWKINFLESPRGYCNYISINDEQGELYYYQPIEEDAFKTGLSLTKKSYEIMSKILGEDVNFSFYAQYNKEIIMKYFSREKEFIENFRENRNKVFELFSKNNKFFQLEHKCLEIAKVTMKKEIKDMSLEEIYSLFSVYVWAYLDDDYKMNLLLEYDSRVNKYKSVVIEKFNNSSFKIGKNKVDRNNILVILNNLFSEQFKRLVKYGILTGIEDCDKNLREDININMYEHEGKKINYVNDLDNFILYSIQPFSLFEGKVVIEQFKKLKEYEEKFYGVNNGDYDSWIDFYDNSKYIPYLEQFYEKSFEEIYEENIQKMRNNINDIIIKKR